MKFKLQATHDDGTVITHEFEEDVWYAALDNFVKFLRGNGYLVSESYISLAVTIAMDYCVLNF